MYGLFYLLFLTSFWKISKSDGTKSVGCGYPGSPANGRTVLETTVSSRSGSQLEVQQRILQMNEIIPINTTIKYVCDDGYNIDGPNSARCAGFSPENWRPSAVPICKENVAFDRPAEVIERSAKKIRKEIVDGNPTTCVSFANVHEWRIPLNKIYKIITIDLRIRCDRQQEVFSVDVIVRRMESETTGKMFNVTQSGKVIHDMQVNFDPGLEGLHITIKPKTRAPQYFSLCEVRVFEAFKPQCGLPSNFPNCIISLTNNAGIMQARYSAKEGYEIEGGRIEENLCFNGTWSKTNLPKCIRSTKISTTSKFEDSTKFITKTTTAKSNETEDKSKTFIIGIAVGVTAASVSTIIVIVVLVIALKKYYKRNDNHSDRMTSETDSVFLRGNLHSSGSANSPAIQANYSDPWDFPRSRSDPQDDPRNHVYDYICPETLLSSKPKDVAETSFSGLNPRVDNANYLLNKQSPPPLPSDDNSARQRLLQPTSTFQPRINPGPSRPVLRTSSFNEIEVDAYGYPEPDDNFKV